MQTDLQASFRTLSLNEITPSANSYAQLAIIYKSLNFYEAGQNILEEGIKQYPNVGWIYLEYAQLELARENYSESVKHWKTYFELRSRKLDKRRGILNNFLKSAFMANDLLLYEEVIYKALAIYPDDETYNLYAHHLAALKDIEQKNFTQARLKIPAIQAIAKNLKTPAHFSINYLKKLIDVQECLVSDNETTLKNLAAVIKYQSRVRINSADVLGIAEYLEIQANKQASIESSNALLEIITALRAIENRVKEVDIHLTVLKSSFYNQKIKELAYFVLQNKLTVELLPSAAWMVLATYCAGGQHIKAYYKLRTLSQQATSLETPLITDAFFVAQRARARAELQQEQYPEDILYLQENGYAEMAALLNLYYGNRKECIHYFADKRNQDDKKFQEYIKDKSIAIVGPVDVGLENGAEIDSFDIVIRFNFKGLEGYNKKVFGSKTHLSPYINGDLIKPDNHSSFAYGMQQLEYLTYQNKSPTNFDTLKHIKTPMRKAYLVWNENKNPSFRSQLNAVQKILADILRFETGKIKLFNANLWIDPIVNTAYRSKAQSGVTPGGNIWHDIISNFNFTKILWENGLFEADEVLAKVLSMTEEEYAMAMAERYEV